MILERRSRKTKGKRRTLLSRKPERVTYPKGVPIRISSLVYDRLRKKRKPKESWDMLLRRFLNMEQRRGSSTPLREVWLLPSTGEVFETKALAKAKSLKNGVLMGKAGQFEVPVFMREVI